MNYRHIYHAGNICDVVKHAIVTLLIDHLRLKDAPFCILDTHAGIGLYDLQDEAALKTGEAQQGIMKLLAATPLPELASYYAVLQKLNGDPFRYYPGSPMLAFEMLRPQDKLIACELHDEDVHALRQTFYNEKQVQIHHRDGYEALRAFLPPTEKRGLVLIDPPYEDAGEFDRLTQSIAEAHRRWPQGMIAAWYPIKERPTIWRFHEALAATGIPKQLCAEFIYQEELRADRLNGSGMIILNPPWQMDERLRHLLPALHQALQTNHQASTVTWLVGE